MSFDPEYAKLWPGIGGALVSSLIKIREGFRVVLVQFVMGAIPVTVFAPIIDKLSHKFEVPSEVIGFGIGLLSVAIAIKAIETVMMLEFAKPANAFIERWTGAKAPSTGESK